MARRVPAPHLDRVVFQLVAEFPVMPIHPTLDAELVVWWECEAERLESLAASARFGVMRRHYARKAATARARAQVSRLREQAREAAGRPAAV